MAFSLQEDVHSPHEGIQGRTASNLESPALRVER
jgi:hypothetical protein